jgi:3-hydroxyanthranilate 3,4-dioxygenase
MQGEGQRSRACSTYSNIAPFSNSPINLNDWIEKNKQTLLPLINNRQFWKEDWQNLMVMMVGGPNYRPDYHDDPGVRGQ